MNREAGYTLLELIVVLAIMGILIASLPGIALPGVAAVQFSGRVQAAVARLNAAHDQAIEVGQTVTMQPAGLEATFNGLALKTNASSIVFFPDGSAEGRELVITSGAQHRILRIDALTGRISVLGGG